MWIHGLSEVFGSNLVTSVERLGIEGLVKYIQTIQTETKIQQTCVGKAPANFVNNA